MSHFETCFLISAAYIVAVILLFPFNRLKNSTHRVEASYPTSHSNLNYRGDT